VIEVFKGRRGGGSLNVAYQKAIQAEKKSPTVWEHGFGAEKGRGKKGEEGRLDRASLLGLSLHSALSG